MKLHSCLRIISITCYSFTFLKGMMIIVPFILVLIMPLTDHEPADRFFLLLADLGLVILAVLHFRKKTKLTIALRCVIYFMLLAPLVRALVNFPLAMFDYALSWVPFGGFVILYPLSVLLSFLEYKHAGK